MLRGKRNDMHKLFYQLGFYWRILLIINVLLVRTTLRINLEDYLNPDERFPRSFEYRNKFDFN